MTNTKMIYEMSNIRKITVGILMCFLSAVANANSEKIFETDYGDEWPFTVNEGVLNCTKNEVTFRAAGLVYAVNGTATTMGYASIDPIWKYDMELIKEIAEALDMTVEETKKSSPLRINIGPIIKTGLKLCDE